jgi:hypothetical protein
VPELAGAIASVVGCYAAPAAIDALEGIVAATVCRVAPDEAMVVGAPGEGTALARVANATLTGVDADALSLDATDGWAVWMLSGPRMRRAFSRLSALRLGDERFVQGKVADVPCRVIASPDRLGLVVPSMSAEHVRSRILRDCADIGMTQAPALGWPGRDGGAG